MADRSDSELVEAATTGDVDSFCQLCSRYYPAMVAIAHAVLGDGHLAEDAAQETFAKASRKLPQLKKLNRLATWLAAICRNVARDMLRRGEKLSGIEDLPPIAAQPCQTEHIDAVRNAVDKLPAAAKELVFLRYYDGMTYQQISAVLGISAQAVNGRLRRTKKKLARTLRRDAEIEVRL